MDVPNGSQVTHLSKGITSRCKWILFIRVIASRRIEEHMKVNQNSELTDDLSEELFRDASRYVLDKDRTDVAFNVRGRHRSRTEIDSLEH
jgi:hypothetical protein